MAKRYHPLGKNSIVTSPFGPRDGGFHTGVDFGFPGGSSNRSVYAIQSGTVIYAGAAEGYGGPDPAGWLVIDSTDDEGGGCLEYGHIVRRVNKGDHVKAGQLIAIINPSSATNGGVAPHLHVSDMPRGYDPATKQNVLPRLVGAADPITSTDPARNPVLLPPIKTPEVKPVPMSDPFTGAVWSPNRYHPRSAGVPRWIAVHTQEGGRTARDLAAFLAASASQVSYHAVNDDRELLKCVAEDDAPWAAAGANNYAFHVCGAGTYSAWSRGKWLETDASDGKNEDLELTNTAKIVAWWCDKYRIPPVWIGGGSIPPWGRDGVCGHMDFGLWGGGHHDPGLNYPRDELMRRVNLLLANAAVVPLPPPIPVGPGGGAPATDTPYVGPVFPLYRGKNAPDNVVRENAELQRRLRDAYASYAGHLAVDGDFGIQTDAAVREFQRRSTMIVDGIVGAQTGAALKLRVVA